MNYREKLIYTVQYGFLELEKVKYLLTHISFSLFL